MVSKNENGVKWDVFFFLKIVFFFDRIGKYPREFQINRKLRVATEIRSTFLEHIFEKNGPY
jgi:hypothetical protein